MNIWPTQLLSTMNVHHALIHSRVQTGDRRTQTMSKRKHNWNKTRPSGGANPPPQNVAEVFGGTLAGGVPISASVLHLEPMRFQVSGVTEALATTELMRVVSDEFTRLGVHQHPVSVEMEIGGTKIRRKLLVVFDESYTCSAMWPIDTVFASAG